MSQDQEQAEGFLKRLTGKKAEQQAWSDADHNAPKTSRRTKPNRAATPKAPTNQTSKPYSKAKKR